jgi:hypothetical protein
LSPKNASGSFVEDLNKDTPCGDDTESKALPRSRSHKNDILATEEFLTPGEAHSTDANQAHIPLYKVDPNEINQKIRDAVPRK